MTDVTLFRQQLINLSFVFFVSVLVSACAGSAPPLPQDTTSTNKQRSISLADFSPNDAAMDCHAIQAEQTANAAQLATDNQAIQANRQQNEIAGYFGALVIVPLVATDNNDNEKDDIDNLQKRQDVLRKLVAVKKCPQY